MRSGRIGNSDPGLRDGVPPGIGRQTLIRRFGSVISSSVAHSFSSVEVEAAFSFPADVEGRGRGSGFIELERLALGVHDEASAHQVLEPARAIGEIGIEFGDKTCREGVIAVVRERYLAWFSGSVVNVAIRESEVISIGSENVAC